MKKEKVATLALVLATIVTIPEIPMILDYIKGPSEFIEMLLALLVRVALWSIIIKVILFVYGLIVRFSKKIH